MKYLKLSFEYGCHPIWIKDDGKSAIFENYDPMFLNISHELSSDLLRLQQEYDQTLDQAYPPDSCFQDEATRAEFIKRANDVMFRLKLEIGNIFFYEMKEITLGVKSKK